MTSSSTFRLFRPSPTGNYADFFHLSSGKMEDRVPSRNRGRSVGEQAYASPTPQAQTRQGTSSAKGAFPSDVSRIDDAHLPHR